MNKERFEEMELELIRFGAADILTTSNDGTDGGYDGSEEDWM